MKYSSLIPMALCLVLSASCREEKTADPIDDDLLPTEMVGSIGAQVNGGNVEVSWILPLTDSLFDHVVLLRKQGSASTGPEDGDELYSGRGESHTDDGLTATGTFHYSVYTCNAEDQCMTEGMSAAVDVLLAPTETVSRQSI
jgi:hypothetical protein